MARNLIWAQIKSIAHTLQIQLIASCLILSFVAPLGAESRVITTTPTEPDFSQVRKLINEQIASKAVPSVSIAVVRRGEIIWEESLGFADLEKSIPATPQTL